MKKYILALFTLFVFSSSAYAITLDFTSGVYTKVGSSTQYNSLYTEDGFSLAVESAGNHFDTASHIVGDVGFHNGPVNPVNDNNLILSMGGTAFNLTSMDFAGFQGSGITLDFIGSDGTTQSITGVAGIYSLALYNVTSVTLSMADLAGEEYAGWNSMEVSAVPVPAAAWLFGSALLGFFGFSRKKANA